MKATELKQIIREEISKALNENLTITDWDEFVNPDHVVLTLSNGKQLKIAKQNIKGGKNSYQAILTLLDNMGRDPKAMEAMLKLVNAMADRLV
jgi:phosphoribosylformylglycinamidine (FGAM) synthase-like amidotransferase family enzyme